MHRGLARYAKWAAALLLTGVFVPGGTLGVLALLLAGRSSRWTASRLLSLAPFQGKNVRLAPGPNPRVNPTIQRME